MRIRLWVKIALTLMLNLAVLAALGIGSVAMQSRRGLDSVLYAQAREKIRDLGAMVEDEFPGKPPAERSSWLATVQQPYGVQLAVYDDTGALIAGPDLHVPESVLREIDRDRKDGERQRGGGRRPRRRDRAPMFLQKEAGVYWIGYHFPITGEPGNPPVRHTLTITTDSLIFSPLFVDWVSWTLGVLAAVFVSALCWIPFVRRVTSSLRVVQEASAEIAQGRFETPVPVTGNDELGDLAQSIRRMSEQLSRLIHGQRRFLADVAHELCAPISRIQLSSGILQQSATGVVAKQVERLERDTAQMSALVGDLLLFTKGASMAPILAPVELEPLVRSVVAQERAEVSVSIDPQVCVLADAEYLRRAVGNLVRNAVRYAGDAGGIEISAKNAGDRVQLLVQDRGPGLPDGELEAVFNPFYTLDGARTPGMGGAGLGLAIVRSCVEACGGRVYCRNRTPKGLAVTLELRSLPN